MLRFLLLALLLIPIATASKGATVRAEGGAVFVNEVKVLTLRASVGKSGPGARAAALAAKLNGRSEVSLTIETSRRSAKIFADGVLLILVNKVEAEAVGSSPAGLAVMWVENLKRAWALPPLQLSTTFVTLPPKGSADIDAIGRMARTAQLFVESKEVATVARQGARLTITPVGVGETTVTVGEGDSAVPVKVRVLPYAATFPQSYSALVVGAPASAATVKGVVEEALKTRLQGMPGAAWSWTASAGEELGTGEKTSYSVKVSATAPDAFPAEGTVTVSVENAGLAHRREAELWYCNDPENVKKPQSLFMAQLRPDTPVRMLYHHINTYSQGLFLRVMVLNKSAKPAQMVVIPGDSKDQNPVLAGVMAADPFFRSWFSGSGELVTIQPGMAMPIAFRRLAPQDTSSGLCYLRLLPAGAESLTVVAEAVLPYDMDGRWQAAQRTPTPWREVGPSVEIAPYYPAQSSDVIFPTPFKQEEFSYSVGGNFSFFRIGQKPIKRNQGQLDGNFGVLYSIQARADNPTSAPSDVELVFEASAGYSGGIFLIDGQFIRLPLVQAKGEARLVRFRLEPGASKSLSIATIPLSGSSYPATLVLRPVSAVLGSK